jgi:cytochrome c oxidase subunit III
MSTETATATTADEGFDFGAKVSSSGKLGMWIFLVTDAMSFGGLLLGYAILRAGAKNWPDPSQRLGIGFTAVMTFDLILSSVTMVLALAYAQQKDRKKASLFLGLTILGGLLFLSGQVKEYYDLLHHHHAGLSVDTMWATFFVPTSFHGLHVFSGVTYLTIIFFQTLRGKYTDGPNASANNIEIAGLFWHFVDLVWILVFTFIYLI